MYDTGYYNSLIAPWRIVREIGHGAFAAVILKACSFNPADRYADAAQMRAALNAAMSDIQPPKPQSKFVPKKKSKLYIYG